MQGLHVNSDEGRQAGQGGYQPPAIRDHGTLTQITEDQGMLFDVTRASVRLMAAAVSTPLVPGANDGTTAGTSGSGPPGSGTAGSGVLGSSGTVDPSSSATVPSAGGVLDKAATGATDPSNVSDPGGNVGGGGSGGGTAGGGSGGGSDGRLPFTGLAVIGIAAVGAATAGSGAALRRMLRRDKAPGDGS